MVEPMKLKVLFADYPITRAMRAGDVGSPLIDFEFSPLKTANKGFKPMVRDLAFDAGELAIATFLQAVDAGKPLVLLPATIVGRFQHHCILYNSDRGAVTPETLAGKTVGVRAYTQTTGMWVRGILQQQFGVDSSSIRWLTFEAPHVAEYVDPPEIILSNEDKSLDAMLLDGELDAAILGIDIPDDPRLHTVIPEPDQAAKAWYQAYGAVPINHVAVVKADLVREHPEVVRELFRVLKESKERAGEPSEIDFTPFGLEAIRPSLELAIQFAFEQKLISRRMSVEELFDPVTIGLS